MKLSEVLQAVQLIKSANQGIPLHKHHHHPHLETAMYADMMPGAGIPHQSPYGHLLLNPHYGHRGHLSGLASVAHGLKFGGAGTSGSDVYGGHPPSGYHATGYGGHMGAPSGGHPAPAGYDYHSAHSTGPHAPIAESVAPIISHSLGKSKGSGSSTITALTLLSFLFFLNILQGCLKEHMETMNPTVMVMTAGTTRTRVSKLAEMNSREQQHTISQSLPQPVLTSTRGDRVADAANIIESQVPFSGGHTKIEYSNSNQRPDPEPEYYSPYANRTLTLVDSNYQDRPHHHSYRHYQRLYGSYSSPPSSLSSLSSSSSTSASSVSSPSAADSPGSNNYYPDAMDPYYMRIN